VGLLGLRCCRPGSYHVTLISKAATAAALFLKHPSKFHSPPLVSTRRSATIHNPAIARFQSDHRRICQQNHDSHPGWPDRHLLPTNLRLSAQGEAKHQKGPRALNGPFLAIRLPATAKHPLPLREPYLDDRQEAQW